tara:strand:- start:2486 stop:3127 length:642 start_codon:yes stop_codon:yes gene_type:complete
MDFKNAIIAFSGGKDSVAISKFMLDQGYKIPHVCVINKELDYPVHLKYVKEYCKNKDVDLTFVDQNHLGMDFLKKNPKFIFPFDSKIKGNWFYRFQQSGIKKYAEKNNCSTVIYGRRTADGNSIKSNLYTTKNGIQQYFPLRDWSNTKTMEYIKLEKLSPIYNNERGVVRGTHTINIANTYKDKNINSALEFIKSMDLQMYNKALTLLKFKTP